MNKFLGYIIGFVIAIIASIVFLTIEVYDDDLYTQAEVDEIVYKEVNRVVNNFEDDEFKDLINYVLELENEVNQQLTSEVFYLQTQILSMEQDLETLDIILDIINETEYNTVESQCLTDDYYVCYNDYFYYHIDSNDKVVLLFGTYNVIGIQMTLERQEDGDFYYTKIGMYDSSSTFTFNELYEVNVTSNHGSTAVSLIQEIIENEYWTSYDSLEDWENLKLDLGIGE